MYLLFLLFFTNILTNIQCKNEFCAIDDKSCRDQEKDNIDELDEKYKEFIYKIKEAEDSYVPCEVKGCECFTNTITEDLKPFRDGIHKKLIEISKERGTLYQIINKKLYREEECMFPARCSGVEHFLLKVAKNMSRNIEFVLNTRDYPQSGIHFGGPLPILSFSKTDDYYDIMYPAWSFWEGGPAISLYPRGLGRWDEHRKSLNASSLKYPWQKKEKKAFFRGSRTSSERDDLVRLSRKNSELVDAAYVKNQAWKSKEDTLGAEPAKEVSLESHCRFKYLFNYRGVAASFRHKHLFLCGSLVFHVGDEWREFYYDAMKPWIHYVPVEKYANQDRLERFIKFAMNNDRLAHKIAKTGQNFIWNKLRMSDVTCYWKELLERYSKLLKYEPELRKNLKYIS